MSINQISVKEAKLMIESKAVQVIDVRDQAAYQSGHIESAVNITDANIEDFISGSDFDKPLIICCYSGNMSQGAAAYFLERGFEEVYSLQGGYSAWDVQS